MAQDETLVRLKEVVKTLPKGWKIQVTGGDKSKNVLFCRMMNRESVGKMTISEYSLLEKLLVVIKTYKKDNERIEKEILKTLE